jgi:hypothetical protein
MVSRLRIAYGMSANLYRRITHPIRVLRTSRSVGGVAFIGNLSNGAPRAYSASFQYNPQGQLIREQFGTSTPPYHRRHYNSRGQLFDVRLGTDGNAVNDGPNPAQSDSARRQCQRVGDVCGFLLLRLPPTASPLPQKSTTPSADSYTLGVFEQQFSFDFAMRMAPKTGVFSTSSLFPRGPVARGGGV